MKTTLSTFIIVCIALLNSGCQTKMEETIEIASSEITTRSTNSYPRELRKDEQEVLQEAFPNLDLSTIKVIGPPTSAYNCIAYSMGYTNQWINPPKSDREFADLYKKHGYDLIYNGHFNIYGWGKSKDDMRHASIKKSSITWASKLGAYICVTHPERANFSSQYGIPRLRFAPMNNTRLQNKNFSSNNITSEEKETIQKKCLLINKKENHKFDSLFNRWLKNWETNPKTMFSNDTGDAKELEEYPQLLAMGKEILPLVVEKLLDEKNFVGLVLYDELQDNPDYKIAYDYKDSTWLEGEANRAKRTVKLWVKSVTDE